MRHGVFDRMLHLTLPCLFMATRGAGEHFLINGPTYCLYLVLYQRMDEDAY